MIISQLEIPENQGQLIYTASQDISLSIIYTNISGGYTEIPYTKFPTQQDQQYYYQAARSTIQHFYRTISIAILTPGQTQPENKSQYIIYESQVLHDYNSFNIDLSTNESIWVFSPSGNIAMTLTSR
jgi:hypothetical protein